jgi:hypothetical protein
LAAPKSFQVLPSLSASHYKERKAKSFPYSLEVRDSPLAHKILLNFLAFCLVLFLALGYLIRNIQLNYCGLKVIEVFLLSVLLPLIYNTLNFVYLGIDLEVCEIFA